MILSLTEHISHFLEQFPKMTKEESDFIADVLRWEDEKKSGFLFAKQIFEEDS